MDLLNWLTLIAYVAVTTDVVLETIRIYRTKSSNDLSLFGMTIRFAAIGVILAKFISLHDTTLILGQCLVALTFLLYFVLALYYLKNKKPKKKRS